MSAVSSVVSAATKTVSSVAATATARAASQAGVIDGANPTKYNPKDPITLFIIQVRAKVSWILILLLPRLVVRLT
jgi:hypothetical protein